MGPGAHAGSERDGGSDRHPAVEPGPADDQGSGSIDEPRCDLCGAPMHEWHCRIICTFCGYQRDCSDP
jgi:hypothetical protein